MRNIVFEALAEAARAGEPVVLGIISGVKGSSPQKIGAKAIFYADGRIKGTLGGGCLEAEIQQRAIQSLRSGEAATFELLLDHDFGWDDGLICGGKVFGLILPNAQSSAQSLWNELAERREAVTWAVGRDFSITRRTIDSSVSLVSDTPALCAPHLAASPHSAAALWLYQETVSPPCALWIAG